MPANPTTPPSGTYSSTCDTDSSWDGTFSYNSTSKAISYTRDTAPVGPFSATNQDNGNAINFSIDDGTDTMHFVSNTFAWKGTNAEYTGTCNEEDGGAGENGWTATQTS